MFLIINSLMYEYSIVLLCLPYIIIIGYYAWKWWIRAPSIKHMKKIKQSGRYHMSYVIIDTIILTNYTNDAYIYLISYSMTYTYTPLSGVRPLLHTHTCEKLAARR
jgi:uncharacterized membrane protein